MAIVAEYIWLDVNKNLRSKTRVITDGDVIERIYNRDSLTHISILDEFDGSSADRQKAKNLCSL